MSSDVASTETREERRQAKRVSMKAALPNRIPLDLIALGLLVWLPIETWVLKFVPHSSPLLAVPDVLCLLCALVIVGVATWSDGLKGLRRVFTLPVIAGLVLAAVAGISTAVNGTSLLELAYFIRVYLRFLPLAMIASTEPWASKVARRLPGVTAIALALQLEVSLFERIGGLKAATVFWPGSFSLGRVTTAVTTLDTVEGRVVAGTLGHYNILGWYVFIASAVLVSWLLNRRIRHSKVMWWTILAELVLAAAVVMMTASRQAAFAAAAASLALGAYLLTGAAGLRRSRAADAAPPSANRGRAITVAGFVVVLALVAVAVTQAGGAWSRYSAVFTPEYWRIAGDNRGYVVQTLVPAVAERSPVVGMGPGSFGRVWAVDAVKPPSAIRRLKLDLHHARYISDVGWANLFGQVGILGTLSVIIVCIALLVAMVRGRRRPQLVALAGGALVLLVIGNVASAPLTYKPISSLLWILIGLALQLKPSAPVDVQDAETDT